MLLLNIKVIGNIYKSVKKSYGWFSNGKKQQIAALVLQLNNNVFLKYCKSIFSEAFNAILAVKIVHVLAAEPKRHLKSGSENAYCKEKN